MTAIKPVWVVNPLLQIFHPMKPLFTLFLLLSTLLPTLAQTPPERLAVTFGILQGGGSLVGATSGYEGCVA